MISGFIKDRKGKRQLFSKLILISFYLNVIEQLFQDAALKIIRMQSCDILFNLSLGRSQNVGFVEVDACRQ